MLLKKVGFFRELPYGDAAGQCLKESIGNRPHDDEDRLVRYLRMATVFVASTGVFTDVLSDTHEIIDTLEILTDGVWAWPSDLAYYVEKYHVRLPRDFIEHVSGRDYVLPPMDGIAIESLRLPPDPT